ncbi:MAG TPA: helix-turn-helix domain-containing protein [Terriglobia bacterium]|nr:helix-turn-helix domain-containing protein [Terriglobia bacterium]
MARVKLSEDALQQLKAATARTRDKAEYQRALCVWLPEVLGLTSRQVAAALGWSVVAVEQVRKRFLHSGASMFQDGRRRPLGPGAAEALSAALERAGSLEEFRRIQCVSLGALLGLDGKQVAAAVGWPRGTVSKFHAAYVRRGLAALLAEGSAPPPAEGAAEKLYAAMKTARGVPEFRQAQCVLLRVALGLDVGQVARILGWSETSVSRVHHRYLREGDEMLRGAGRGGARWRVLTRKQEADLLRRLASQAWPNGLLMFPVIHRAVEEAAGRPVSAAYVQAMLDRHGWCLAAVVVTPVQTRPPEAAPPAPPAAQTTSA